MSIVNKILLHSVQVVSLLLFLGFVIFIAKPGIEKLQNRIVSEKENLISLIELETGFKIKYSSISPMIFDSIVINDVEAINEGNNFKVSRISIKFSLINIVLSNWIKVEPLEIVSSINIREGTLNVDLDSQLFNSSSGSGSLNTRLFKTKVFFKDVSAEVINSNMIISAKNVKGSVITRFRRYYINLDGDVLYKNRNSDIPLDYISLNCDIDGFLESSLQDLAMDLSIANIKSDIGTLENQNLNITLFNNQLQLDSSSLFNPIKFKFKYGVLTKKIFVTLNADKSKITDIYNPSDIVPINSNYLQFVLDGSLEGEYDLKSSYFMYKGKGNLKAPDIINNIDATVQFDLLGDLDSITVNSLDVWSSVGYGGFYGFLDLKTYFPRGRLYFRDIQINDNIQISSNISVKPINNRFINIDMDYLRGGGLSLDNIKSLLYIDDNEVNLQLLQKGEDDKVLISGSYKRDSQDISGSVEIDKYKLETLGDIPSLVNFKDYLVDNNLTLNGKFSYSNGDLQYNINHLNIGNSENSDLLLARGFGNQKDFTLDYLELHMPDLDVIGSLDGNLKNERLTLSVDSLINDNKYKFNSVISKNRIIATGSYDFFMDLNLADSQKISLYAEEFPVKYRDIDTISSFTINGELYDNNNFNISIPRFITEVDTPLFKNRQNLSFSLDGSNEKIQISDIIYMKDDKPLTGNININITNNDLLYIVGDLNGDRDESISLTSTFSIQNRSISMDSTFNNLLLDRFSIEGLSGTTDLKFKISGDIENFSGEGELLTGDVLFNGYESNSTTNFKINNNLISLQDLKSKINGHILSIPLITYNYKEGSIAGSFSATILKAQMDILCDMVLDASTTPVNSILELSPELVNNLNGTLNLLSMKGRGEVATANKKFRFFNNRSALQVYSVDRNLRFLHSYGTGYTNLQIKQPYFADLSMVGTVKDGVKDLKITDLKLDGEVLKIYIPGLFTVDNITLMGDLNITGDSSSTILNGLLWTDTKMGFYYFKNDTRKARFNFRIVDNQINLLPMDIYLVDGSKFQLDGEVNLRNSLTPKSVIFNISSSESSRIPAVFSLYNFTADMEVYTPNIMFYWDNSGSFLNGDLFVKNGELFSQATQATESDIDSDSDITKSVEKDAIDSFRDYDERFNLMINLNIILDDNNKLFWPRKSYPIIDANLKSGDEIAVKYNYATTDYEVTGKVSILSGDIDYSGEPFVLSEGYVEFDVSKDNIDPYLNFVGSKTVIDDNDRQVELILTFQGAFFSDFKPTITSSDPSLTTEEISRLAGQAILGDSLADFGVGLVDEFLTSFVVSSVEEGIKNLTGADNVRIKSGFISSVFSSVLENYMSNSSENITNNSFETENESGYNLSEMLNNTSLTLGNFITDDFFVKGTVGTSYSNGDLLLDMDLGLTLYTPHFQLGIEMAPNFNDDYVFQPELGLSIEWILNP